MSSDFVIERFTIFFFQQYYKKFDLVPNDVLMLLCHSYSVTQPFAVNLAILCTWVRNKDIYSQVGNFYRSKRICTHYVTIPVSKFFCFNQRIRNATDTALLFLTAGCTELLLNIPTASIHVSGCPLTERLPQILSPAK